MVGQWGAQRKCANLRAQALRSKQEGKDLGQLPSSDPKRDNNNAWIHQNRHQALTSCQDNLKRLPIR